MSFDMTLTDALLQMDEEPRAELARRMVAQGVRLAGEERRQFYLAAGLTPGGFPRDPHMSASEFANQIFWQRSRDGVGVRKVGEEQRGVSCQGCRSDVVALVIEVGKDHLPASFALCRKCAAIIGDDLGKALQGG